MSIFHFVIVLGILWNSFFLDNIFNKLSGSLLVSTHFKMKTVLSSDDYLFILNTCKEYLSEVIWILLFLRLILATTDDVLAYK